MNLTPRCWVRFSHPHCITVTDNKSYALQIPLDVEFQARDVDELLASFQRAHFPQVNDFGQRLSFLGSSFTLAYFPSDGGLVLATGPQADFRLYWRTRDDYIEVSDRLPLPEFPSQRIEAADSQVFVALLGNALAVGPFVIRRTSRSVFPEWSAVPNGHYVTLRVTPDGRCRGDAKPIAFDNLWSSFQPDPASDSTLIQAIGDALSRRVRTCSAGKPLGCEISGGIDSGIVFSECVHSLGLNRSVAINGCYPFFEFSRERAYCRQLLNHLGAHVVYNEWRHMLPYSWLGSIPAHDEPDLGSTNWGQSASLCEAAASSGCAMLLTGHGGDRLFLEDPFVVPSARQPLTRDRPTWLPKQIYDAAMDEALATRAHLARTTKSGISWTWNAAMFEPPWASAYVVGCTPVRRYVSGFRSTEVLRAVASLWAKRPQLPPEVQKPIARLIFGDRLPSAIWRRPSKVNHLGTTYRGFRRSAQEIREQFSSAACLCDHFRIRQSELRAAIDAAINGIGVEDIFLTFILAIAFWANARSAQRESAIEIPLSPRNAE